MLERAATYVREYQAALASVVATEDYSQQVVARYPPDPRVPRARRLESEIFFLYVPGFDWMTIRDVRSVDGVKAPRGQDVLGALRRSDTRDVATQFKRDNSRFNIGRTFRNFNEPTLSLLVLDDRYRDRFSFERTNTRREGTSTTATFAFREEAAPTLIRDSSGGNVFASGELVVDAESGRVMQAVLRVAPDGVEMTLSTDYVPSTHLGMLVPSRFREHYVNGTPPHDARPVPGARQAQRQFGSFYEEIVCEATYRDFRRFEVKARIR